MEWLKRLKVSRLRISKFSIKYKILTIACVAIAGFAGYLTFMSTVATSNAERLASVKNVFYPILDYSNTNIVLMERYISGLEVAITVADADLVTEAKAYIDTINANLDSIESIEPNLATNHQELRSAVQSYIDPAQSLATMLVSGSADFSKIPDLMANANTNKEIAQEALKFYSEQRYVEFTTILQETDEAFQNGLYMGLITVIAILVALTLIAYWIAEKITSNIKSVSDSLNDMASGQGDLTRRLETKTQDELADLVGGFNSFVGKLQSIVSQVVASSETMITSIEQISSAIASTSVGANDQNNKTVEVATSIESLVHNVNTVSRNATEAADFSIEALNAAESGKSIVSLAVGDMNNLADLVRNSARLIDELGEKSDNISNIVKVIYDITAQTNLLALNATIEAARAGDRGKGFAIVANEVRTLATRTEDSAKTIKSITDDLISQTQSAVTSMEKGLEQVEVTLEHSNKTGSALFDIIQSVDNINKIIQKIATATGDQSSAADIINESIYQVSEISISTASAADRTVADSKELLLTASDLKALVNQFKI